MHKRIHTYTSHINHTTTSYIYTHTHVYTGYTCAHAYISKRCGFFQGKKNSMQDEIRRLISEELFCSTRSRLCVCVYMFFFLLNFSLSQGEVKRLIWEEVQLFHTQQRRESQVLLSLLALLVQKYRSWRNSREQERRAWEEEEEALRVALLQQQLHAECSIEKWRNEKKKKKRTKRVKNKMTTA